MTSVRWTRGAVEDLKKIRSYIDMDDAKAAARWIQRLRERARLASTQPQAGRIVPEFGRDDVREVFVRTYRIVYRIVTNEIHVLTVFEGSRLLRPSDLPDETDE